MENWEAKWRFALYAFTFLVFVFVGTYKTMTGEFEGWEDFFPVLLALLGTGLASTKTWKPKE